MKRISFFLCLLGGFIILLAFLVWPMSEALALPEYSAQTGEPCASCHISPSGGGPRTPRGQAWIADGKPGAVPDLLASLDLLGVDLDVNPADFTTVPDEVPPAPPLPLQPGQAENLFQHLLAYPGN